MINSLRLAALSAFSLVIAGIAGAHAAAQAWQPTKNVEIIIPGGTGGGQDRSGDGATGPRADHQNLAAVALVHHSRSRLRSDSGRE